jgi:hypothetical protein
MSIKYYKKKWWRRPSWPKHVVNYTKSLMTIKMFFFFCDWRIISIYFLYVCLCVCVCSVPSFLISLIPCLVCCTVAKIAIVAVSSVMYALMQTQQPRTAYSCFGSCVCFLRGTRRGEEIVEHRICNTTQQNQMATLWCQINAWLTPQNERPMKGAEKYRVNITTGPHMTG